jgi:regulator of sigma E protease
MSFSVILGGAVIAVAVVLLFGITILIHELGHFLVARACGMVVDVFSIGFGHAIWKKTHNGITYKIGWIPFGGYVALPQMEPPSAERKERMRAAAAGERGADGEELRDLPPVAPWKKILVALAGAVGNVLLAIVLAWTIYLSPSAVTGEGGTVVGAVATNSAAYAQGMRVGDEIAAVNGKAVRSWYEYRVECLLGAGRGNSVTLTLHRGDESLDVTVPTVKDDVGSQIVEGVSESLNCIISSLMPGRPAALAGLRDGDVLVTVDGANVVGTEHFIELIANRGGQEVAVGIERLGVPQTVRLTPEYSETEGRAIMGAIISSDIDRVPPWMHFKKPVAQLRSDAMAITRILQALVTPSEARAAASGMGGPVSIFSMLWMAVQMGVMSAFGFIRFLNINLAILNLLPIPVLDGGHIVFSLYEIVARREPSARVIHSLVNVFVVLLITVFVLLTFKDVRLLRKLWLRGDGGNAATTHQVQAPQTAEPVPAP